MRQELDLVRASVTPTPTQPKTASRRDLRLVTDDLIHGSLLKNDLPGLIGACALSIITVAKILASYEQEPAVESFVEAAQAHIENGRAVMDKGLTVDSWETANCGAVMIEITVRGVCACLGVPYDLALAEALRAQQDGTAPDIRRVLTEAGILKETPDEAANS